MTCWRRLAIPAILAPTLLVGCRSDQSLVAEPSGGSSTVDGQPQGAALKQYLTNLGADRVSEADGTPLFTTTDLAQLVATSDLVVLATVQSASAAETDLDSRVPAEGTAQSVVSTIDISRVAFVQKGQTEPTGPLRIVSGALIMPAEHSLILPEGLSPLLPGETAYLFLRANVGASAAAPYTLTDYNSQFFVDSTPGGDPAIRDAGPKDGFGAKYVGLSQSQFENDLNAAIAAVRNGGVRPAADPSIGDPVVNKPAESPTTIEELLDSTGKSWTLNAATTSDGFCYSLSPDAVGRPSCFPWTVIPTESVFAQRLGPDREIYVGIVGATSQTLRVSTSTNSVRTVSPIDLPSELVGAVGRQISVFAFVLQPDEVRDPQLQLDLNK